MRNGKENANIILMGMIIVVPLVVFFLGGFLIKDLGNWAIAAFAILMLLKIMFISKAIYEELRG